MIFSGTVQTFRCPACGHETQRTRSTALLYYFALIAVGSAVLLPVARHRFGHHAWQLFAVPPAELALVVLLIATVSLWDKRQSAAPPQCPRCAAPLQQTGSGFYDFALLPNTDDLFVGLAHLLAHATAIVLLVRK